MLPFEKLLARFNDLCTTSVYLSHTNLRKTAKFELFYC